MGRCWPSRRGKKAAHEGLSDGDHHDPTGSIGTADFGHSKTSGDYHGTGSMAGMGSVEFGHSAGTVGPTRSEKAIAEGRKPCKGPKAPAACEVQDDAASVHLNVRFEHMRKAFRCFAVCYTKLHDETEWSEVGKTEVATGESKFPNFQHELLVPFKTYTQQLVRFEVYKVKTQDLSVLREQQYIGCAEYSIMETIFARCTGDGFCIKPIKHPKAHAPFMGSIAIWAEEDAGSKSTLFFVAKGEKLRRTDIWKPSVDGFLVVHRADPSTPIDFKEIATYHGAVGLNQVIHTEVVRRTKNPTWKRIEISVQGVCSCRGRQKIVMEIWDWFRMGDPRLVGTALITYDEIYKNFVDGKPVVTHLCKRKKKIKYEGDPFELSDLELPEGKDKSEIARIVIDGVEVQRTYSMLDFMRSGTQIVPIFAVDFTRSTGLRDVAINSGNSRPPPGEEFRRENDYAATIEALGSVLQQYNTENSFPCYGFGAKVPPTHSVCSHAFALNGDFFNPEIKGVDNVLEFYESCLAVTRLHGPTVLNPVIELASKWARPYAEVHTVNDNNIDMKYMVLLLVTDGGVQDQQQVINTLVECTALPISVVIVQIGDEEDPFLKDVEAEVRANQELREVGERDFIHMARFNDFRDDPRGLAHATLYKIPEDVATYFKAIDVQPRDLDRYEDDRGTPLPRPKVDCATAAEPGHVGNPDLRDTASSASGTTSSAKAPAVDVMDAMKMEQEELERQILRLPGFLQDKREELLESAQILGYQRPTAARVLREGLADDSLDILADNILHTGYGKCASFKDAIAEEVKQKKQRGYERSMTKETAASVNHSAALSDLEALLEEEEEAYEDEVLEDDRPDSRSESGVGDSVKGDELSGSGMQRQVSDESGQKLGRRMSTNSSQQLSSLGSQSDSRGERGSKELSVSFGAPGGGRQSSGSRNSTISASGRVSISKELSVSFSGSKDLPVRNGSREVSKDPPSSDGGGQGRRSTRTRTNSATPSKELYASLPGAVEYYDAEPENRAQTPQVTKCTICMERKISVEFVPCGHRITCEQCADSVGQVCPLCRTPVRGRKAV